MITRGEFSTASHASSRSICWLTHFFLSFYFIQNIFERLKNTHSSIGKNKDLDKYRRKRRRKKKTWRSRHLSNVLEWKGTSGRLRCVLNVLWPPLQWETYQSPGEQQPSTQLASTWLLRRTGCHGENTASLVLEPHLTPSHWHSKSVAVSGTEFNQSHHTKNPRVLPKNVVWAWRESDGLTQMRDSCSHLGCFSPWAFSTCIFLKMCRAEIFF